MLHPKSGEHLKLAVVHRDRNVHNQLAVGILQDLPKTFVQVKFLRGKVEARRLRLPGIDFLFERNSFHRLSDYDHDSDWPVKGLGPEANVPYYAAGTARASRTDVNGESMKTVSL